MTVGFLGLGLIGGSIAKCIREKYPDTIIIAYNRTKDRLKMAIEEGIIDVALSDASAGFSDCDIIFICMPVITAIDYLPLIKTQLKKGAVLTDVGSTKTRIHEEIAALGMTECFIGGHPMTGSEKTGYEYSNSLLLENAYYMLTPSEDVPDEKVRDFEDLIRSLGSLPLVLSYKEHDKVVAAISHLPHLISATLVNLVHAEDSDRHLMKTVAAGGFKDITRISSSSPAMWQEICLANGEDIIELLDHYIAMLRQYRTAISERNGDALFDIFSECKAFRDSFLSQGRGEYRIYCDIADEEGAIARIAALLAQYHISIENIGIVHNREFEQGVLKINFYDKTSLSRAVRTLKGSGYTIYEN